MSFTGLFLVVFRAWFKEKNSYTITKARGLQGHVRWTLGHNLIYPILVNIQFLRRPWIVRQAMLLLEKCNKNKFTLYCYNFSSGTGTRESNLPQMILMCSLSKDFFWGEYGQNPAGVFPHFVKHYENFHKCVWRTPYILEYPSYF
jgi:hypothetical protein